MNHRTSCIVPPSHQPKYLPRGVYGMPNEFPGSYGKTKSKLCPLLRNTRVVQKQGLRCNHQVDYFVAERRPVERQAEAMQRRLDKPKPLLRKHFRQMRPEPLELFDVLRLQPV